MSGNIQAVLGLSPWLGIPSLSPCLSGLSHENQWPVRALNESEPLLTINSDCRCRFCRSVRDAASAKTGEWMDGGSDGRIERASGCFPPFSLHNAAAEHPPYKLFLRHIQVRAYAGLISFWSWWWIWIELKKSHHRTLYGYQRMFFQVI